jgi:hypothetical protein
LCSSVVWERNAKNVKKSLMIRPKATKRKVPFVNISLNDKISKQFQMINTLSIMDINKFYPPASEASRGVYQKWA